MEMQKINFGDTLTCHETGKQFIAAQDGCSTNYARDAGGNVFSDEGVNIRQRRDLLDRTRPFVAYVSGDGRHVSGWKGNELGDVIHSHAIECPRRSWVHGSHMLAIRVRDVHGGLWYGRGSPGVAVTLRPCKTNRV